MDTARPLVCLCMCLSMFVGCICGRTPLGRAAPGTADSETPDTDAGVLLAVFPKEEACQSVVPDPSLPARLVDIIMVVDNAGSMVEELAAVQSNINVNFAQRLDASMVDYRVILLSDYGEPSTKGLCFPAPLGGLPCSPLPSQPANGPQFFHYDVKVDGLNSLSLLLSTYGSTDGNSYALGGWKTLLRQDSLKAFIEITSGDPSMVAAEFEAALLATTPTGTFGDATHPNHIFHSIVGVAPNDPPTEPWLSTDPVTSVKCASAIGAGLEYQHLSIRTGGLRFPVCELSSYGAAFQALAHDIGQATTVQCDFTAPPPPSTGQRYGRAYVEYTPTVGPVEYFLPAADPSACSASGFLRDATSDGISLCPQACARLRADATAQISVLYACVSSAGL
jgi:hypothetical protein